MEVHKRIKALMTGNGFTPEEQDILKAQEHKKAIAEFETESMRASRGVSKEILPPF